MARTTPTVSVITIFLNEERFLNDAIESVRGQTYGEWELVLVDDGSTDSSSDLARAAVLADRRIRYVSHPQHANLGMSASRNRGVAASVGDLVAFLDADDTWLPHKLAEQVELMQRFDDVGMVYGRTEWWYSWSGRPEDAARDYRFDPQVPLDAAVDPPTLVPLLVNEGGAPPYTCSMMVRRSVYDRVGGFEEAFRGLFEDQVFFAKVFLETPVYVSSRCWDRYRQHESNFCAIGVRTGEFHPVDLNPARRAFLEWLSRHLRQRDDRHPALERLVAAALEPYRYPAAPTVTKSIAVSGKEASELAGCSIDFPQEGERTAGRIVPILGWAVGRDAKVKEVELAVAGERVGTAALAMRRPDLAIV
ncbi:MAG: glycosyltransferase family 2 protein, partial [Actinomycetota bacterium]|nr:glycosyltransferase family 2 protein [Actinomycetota bacterium]